MRTKRRVFQNTLLAIALILSPAVSTTAQQKTRVEAGPEVVRLGRGMGLMTADLMQIAAQSDLFLRLVGKIDLTKEQQTKLEEMFFEIQRYIVRRQADLDVADAELRRLATGDNVDLAAVRGKLKEIEAIQAETTMKKIETILQAIKTLTHGQHVKVMLLVRDLQNQAPPTGTNDGGF